jgi:hypothetical protein
MKRNSERNPSVWMPQSNMAASLPNDFPPVTFEDFHETLPGYDRQRR